MAEMTPIFHLNVDEKPMATETIYQSSDESENSTSNSVPDHYPERNCSDSHNGSSQLIVMQLEQRSNIGTAVVFCPPTPITSMISDDDEQHCLPPRIGNPARYTSHIPQRRSHPKQLCQEVQTNPKALESPHLEGQDQSYIFRPTTYATHRQQHSQPPKQLMTIIMKAFILTLLTN